MAGAANSPEWYRATFTDISTSGFVASGATGAPAIVASGASGTVFVQKITTNIVVSAAQSITYQDTANTPVVVDRIEASAASGAVRTIDFGAKGYALTEGKALDINLSAAGCAFSYSVEGYRKQTATSASTTINRTI